TPDDMKWPEDGWNKPLQEAARPQLAGRGVRLEWVEHQLNTSPRIEIVGRYKGPLPDRLRLSYHADGPAMKGPHGVDGVLSGVKPRKGKAEELAALKREATLGRLVSDEVLSGGLSYFAFARDALAGWKSSDPNRRWREEPPPRGWLYEVTTG